MPSGRYFWSKYESEYRIGLEHSTLQDPAIRREAPSSASDTFEIIAGTINYIGDWEMRIRTEDFTAHRRWSVEISQNKKTLERLFEHFPEYANQYEIYLSMMGKKAVSLQEFLRIVAEHFRLSVCLLPPGRCSLLFNRLQRKHERSAGLYRLQHFIFTKWSKG